MKIIPIGTKIITEIGQVKGIITAISIRGANGEYNCYEMSYFQNGVYTTCWMLAFEFKIDNSHKAGFKKYDEENNALLIE